MNNETIVKVDSSDGSSQDFVPVKKQAKEGDMIFVTTRVHPSYEYGEVLEVKKIRKEGLVYCGSASMLDEGDYMVLVPAEEYKKEDIFSWEAEFHKLSREYADLKKKHDQAYKFLCAVVASNGGLVTVADESVYDADIEDEILIEQRRHDRLETVFRYIPAHTKFFKYSDGESDVEKIRAKLKGESQSDT